MHNLIIFIISTFFKVLVGKLLLNPILHKNIILKRYRCSLYIVESGCKCQVTHYTRIFVSVFYKNTSNKGMNTK